MSSAAKIREKMKLISPYDIAVKAVAVGNNSNRVDVELIDIADTGHDLCKPYGPSVSNSNKYVCYYVGNKHDVIEEKLNEQKDEWARMTFVCTFFTTKQFWGRIDQYFKTIYTFKEYVTIDGHKTYTPSPYVALTIQKFKLPDHSNTIPLYVHTEAYEKGMLRHIKTAQKTGQKIYDSINNSSHTSEAVLNKPRKRKRANPMTIKSTERGHQQVKTPVAILEACKKALGQQQMYDPCPVQPVKNGLVGDWDGPVNFVNPPYTNMMPWVLQAEKMAEEHGQKTFILCPANTNTYWFSRLMSSKHVKKVLFLQKYITFEGYQKHLPIDMMLVLVAKDNDKIAVRFGYIEDIAEVFGGGGDGAANKTPPPILN
jgi:hypothetical protein